MARIIVISSGKGGVGKTTTAINLAAAFNKFGKNVIVVDANLTTPNVGLHLGAPVVPISLTHVLSGKARLHEAIYEHHSGMKVLPASISFAALRGIKPEKLEDVAKQLKKINEISVFDSAAGLGREAVTAIRAGDDVLIVTQAEMPALTDALKTIRLAEQLDKNIKGVILTRVRQNRYELPLENVESMLEVPVISAIPEDEAVKESLRLKDAVVHTHPESRAARSYKELAAKLLGRKYVEQLEKEGKKGALYKLLRKLRLAE